MKIPENILREHIFQAMLKVKKEGVPSGRECKNWALRYENENYPCKLLISFANIYANGKELDPNNAETWFDSAAARKKLGNLGFEIVRITK